MDHPNAFDAPDKVPIAWSDPVLGWIEAYFALSFTLALFYGAMGKFPWLRETVAKILSPLSRK